MSTVELRSPKVRISYPLGQASPDEVEIRAEVNKHTTAKFTAYSGSEASQASNPVFSSEAAAKMGKAQQLSFSRRLKPDTSINIDDGKNGGKSYSMFLTGPSFSLSSGRVIPSFNAVEKAAMLSNLRLDIYTTFTGREQGPGAPFGESAGFIPDEIKSTNLATRLKELTEKSIKYWQDHANNAGVSYSATSAELKKQRHAINLQGPLDVWYEMLDNSVEALAATSTWLSTLAKYKGVNNQVNAELLAILRGTSRDFQEILDALCDTFQMMVVPSYEGKAPRFILQQDVLLGDTKTLQLPATTMLLEGDVSADLLPVQQVLVRGTPHESYMFSLDPAKKKTDEGYFFVGGFPETAASASGDIAIVPLPSFAQEAIRIAPNPVGNKPPDKKGFGSTLSSVKKVAMEYTNQISLKLIKEYAKATYINLAIGGSTTSISLPADTSLWPGDRYKVTNAAGELLFTGFLAGVSHSFKKQTGGSGGQAQTTCNFTHILFPGFTLPGF